MAQEKNTASSFPATSAPDRKEQDTAAPASRQKEKNPTHEGEVFHIVGIGASAGGLDALKKFFREIPGDSGLAFVVVVHLSPDRESHLTELLQPSCPIPVQQVTETVALKPDRVYIIPPNANLNTIDTHLRLSELETQRRERAPIDHFLRTLALTHGDHAIGVILTGTGSDGTLGLRQIKENGGLTIVQEPEEAEFDGMPRSAILSGSADIVLPIRDMMDHILRFARTRPRVPTAEPDRVAPEETERHLQKIFAHIRTASGRDFGHYKRSTIMRRIRRRMQIHHLDKLDAYVNVLRHNRDEVKSLADDLLITVTEFFRDQETFAVLEKKVIPRLFDGKSAEDQVRVWSVGCSTGEEAYSLAMLLLEEAYRRDKPPQLQVFASDLHENVLKRAREGIYPESIRTDVSAERLRRFFTREDSTYRVRKSLREFIVFAPHNLLRDPPFAHIDLITCRNLLIYLQRDAQRDVAAIFHYALNPDGHMMLGTAETLERSDLFVREDKEHCLYRRRNVPTRTLHLPMLSGGFERHQPRERTFHPGSGKPGPGYGTIHEKMVERYAPPSILVNEYHEVMHYSAHAGRYLQLPGGEPTSNLFKLVREPLRIELRAALHAARESGCGVRSKPVPVQIEAKPKQVVLRVRQADESDLKGFFLIIFDEIEIPPDAAAASDEILADATVKELEAELDLTKNRLQMSIEEYESSQEEMKASLEELQSTNEELRSTMEELETSKEELQSMNEELSTLNQENRHRIEELSQLSADLQNLMSATNIPTLFLDRDLRILRFTPQVSEIFSIRITDRGRPLSDLTHRLGDNELQHDAQQVLDHLVPLERELQSEEDRWYLTRILPYRTDDNRIEGVVITLIDITGRKRAEDSLRRLNETLEQQVAERTELAESRTRQLQSLAVELIEAEERERQRIAGLLHDDLQQLLASARMQLQVAVKDLPDIPVLQNVNRLIGESIRKSRSLSHELSPPVLHHACLVDALQWLAGQMTEQFGLNVRLDVNTAVGVVNEPLKAYLFRALQELLFNAHKHSGKNDIHVALTAEDHRFRLTVRDEGKGFDPAILTSGSAKSGLGLLSLLERTRSLGGNLKIESAPGEGSRFTLTVPVDLTVPLPFQQTAPPPGPRPEPPPPPAASAGKEGIRVLFADDHQVMRQGLISMIIEQPEIQVIGEAENGREALEMTRKLRPDVVVMDVTMPEMGGIEATRRIKTELPHIRVIGLSMIEDQQIAQSLREAGAESFVSKTASVATLLKAIYGMDRPKDAPPPFPG